MRCETFRTFIENEMNQRNMDFEEKVERAYEKDKDEAESSFLKQMNQLFTQCHKMQKEGRKNAVSYVMIYPLRMGFQSGSYDVMISLLDSIGYSDRKEATAYWVPEYLIPVIEEEKRYYEKALEKQFIRVMFYEKKDALVELFEECYFEPLKRFFKKQIESCKELESYQAMDKEDDIRFLYGEYMEEMIQL